VEISKPVLGPAYRALYLNLILGEVNNLCVVDIVSHIGKILHELKEIKQSRDFILKAIQLTEYVYGSVNLNTAHLCHVMAMSWFTEDTNESMKYETRNHEICKKLLGEKDIRTMEANIWMSQLSKNNNSQFLSTKKKQQQIKSKREARQGTDISHVINPDLAALPVNDVLKYIEGSTRNPRLVIPSKTLPPRSNNKSTPTQTTTPKPEQPQPTPSIPQTSISSNSEKLPTDEELPPETDQTLITQPQIHPNLENTEDISSPKEPSDINGKTIHNHNPKPPQQHQQNQNGKYRSKQNRKRKPNKKKP
jgi:hypothetical protein